MVAIECGSCIVVMDGRSLYVRIIMILSHYASDNGRPLSHGIDPVILYDTILIVRPSLSVLPSIKTRSNSAQFPSVIACVYYNLCLD